MVSFWWNFSSVTLVIWVEYDMINSTLWQTVVRFDRRAEPALAASNQELSYTRS